MIDRFDGREEPRWNYSAFADGQKARYLGDGQDQCPLKDGIGDFWRRSWLAGWADADMAIKADEDSGRGKPYEY